MKISIQCVIIALLIGFGGSLKATWKTEEVTQYSKKEIINDITFVYQEEMINGALKKGWFVNGKPVDHERYLTLISQAEAEYNRQQREIMQERRDRESSLQNRIRTDAAKKMLHNALDEVDEELNRIYNNNLESYLSFNEHSYASNSEFEQFIQQTLPAVRALAQSPEEHPLAEYTVALEELATVPEKLRELFYATTHNAIKVCSDTKMLKEYLNSIA